MPTRAVHRRLTPGGKIESGADVTALQEAVNAFLRSRRIASHQLDVDGEYGPKTHAGALRALYYMGVTRRSVGVSTKDPKTLTWRAQTVIRAPKQRSAAQKARGWQRQKRFHYQHNHGPDAAVRWAAAQVGTTENPAGSNQGPGICDWQRKWLGWCGYSWCGAFAGYALWKAGVKGLVGKEIVYTPSIVNDARAGRNGFEKLVPLSEARKGDLLLYNWDGGVVDHVGLFTGKRAANGDLIDIEGNTSSDDQGSQSNGGGVFERHRSPSLVQYVARPKWN